MGVLIYIMLSKKNLECPKCPDLKCPVSEKKNLIKYRAINDPLHPPTKKYEGLYDYIMPNFLKSRSSRGPLPQYQYIGNAIGKDINNSKDDIILQIFGRQKYRGSNSWDHYGLHPHNNIKYTLDISKELKTNDNINIREHNDYNFTFYENEFDNDRYRYNPYF